MSTFVGTRLDGASLTTPTGVTLMSCRVSKGSKTADEETSCVLVFSPTELDKAPDTSDELTSCVLVFFLDESLSGKQFIPAPAMLHWPCSSSRRCWRTRTASPG